MPDKNIGLTVDAEIVGLLVAAWLEPLAKLNLPNPIRARALAECALVCTGDTVWRTAMCMAY